MIDLPTPDAYRTIYKFLSLQRKRIEMVLRELVIGPGPIPIAIVVQDDMPIGIECSCPRLILLLPPGKAPRWEPTPVFSDYTSRAL